MSVLQEYENARKLLGEEKYNLLQQYLNFYPDVLLSDVYYKTDEWKKFEDWIVETDDVVRNNTPLLFIVENYKGLSEHNFVMTREDFGERFALQGKFLEQVIKEETYYLRSNISYDICLIKTIKDLQDFLNGSLNSDKDEMIELNSDEFDDLYRDWYWDNEYSLNGKNANKVLMQYILDCKDTKVRSDILLGFKLADVYKDPFAEDKLQYKINVFDNEVTSLVVEDTEKEYSSQDILAMALEKYPNQFKEVFAKQLSIDKRIAHFENMKVQKSDDKTVVDFNKKRESRDKD